MIKPGTILGCTISGPHGKPVVAVIGRVGDYAVYEQAYPEQTTVDLIARQGDKISEDQARSLFPELKQYKWRR